MFFRDWRLKRAFNLIQGEIFTGKAEDAVEDGRTQSGWVTLLGTDVMKKSNTIWKNYSTAEMEALYRAFAVVYACARKICNTFLEARIMIGKQTPQGWEEIPNHPLIKLLKRPNDSMTQQEADFQSMLHLLITGETYITMVKNGAGYPAALWPFPTSWVHKAYTADQKELAHYEVYNGTGAPMQVPLEDMIWSYFPDATHPLYAAGPLKASLRDHQTDEERGNYLVEMLTNVKTPGIIMHQEASWDVEQKKEARATLADVLGPGRRGSPLFSSGDKGTIEFPTPLKDLDWPGLSNLDESRICSAFDMPPIVVHLRIGLEHGTYSNYEQALRAFYRGTMGPLWKWYAGALTRGLLWDQPWGNDLEFRYDTSQIKQLQEDEETVAKRSILLFHGGLITRNRARELVGEDPLPTPVGDVLAVPINMLERPVNEKPATADDKKDGKEKHLEAWEDAEGKEEPTKEPEPGGEKPKGKNRVAELVKHGSGGNGK